MRGVVWGLQTHSSPASDVRNDEKCGNGRNQIATRPYQDDGELLCHREAASSAGRTPRGEGGPPNIGERS
jgi:hypothetical protein